MKKKYMKPSLEEVLVQPQGQLLAASGPTMTITDQEADYNEVGEAKKLTNPDLWVEDED